jgi:DMSO/TMAO reductase YedYZ molybdopterin-dependent catalytic subunit
MQHDEEDKKHDLGRRRFLRSAGIAGVAGIAGSTALKAVADTGKGPTRVFTAPDQPNPPIINQPFPVPGNDDRPIVQYPEKRPLIRVTSRPPQLETPMTMLNADGITPNDAFFVRYHNSEIPLDIDPKTYTIDFKANTGIYDPLTSEPTFLKSLTLRDLRQMFDEVSVMAVNQCSGNSRGFEDPRMPGGQLGNGTVGCAKWTGVRLWDVLQYIGVPAGTEQIIFNGLDLPDDEPPDFVKAIPINRAQDPNVILAYGMNGEELPMLNGYPLKLIVPGWYGTYWVKHVSEIIFSDNSDFTKMFYMGTAYRIPNNGTGYIPPGTSWPPSVGAPDPAWIPITRIRVRSFITNLVDGAKVRTGRKLKIEGIAFDGGDGIQKVEVSTDGGSTWTLAKLKENQGIYAFREWTYTFTPPADGIYALKVKATSTTGETQPADPALCWNPNGYMRNVIETVTVNAVSSV